MLQLKQVSADVEVSLFPEKMYEVRKGFMDNIIFRVRPIVD